MDAGFDELVSQVLARLRDGIGDAWQDPVRVHVDVRAKHRPKPGWDWQSVVQVFFPTGLHVVVVESFGAGPESWVIRVGG